MNFQKLFRVLVLGGATAGAAACGGAAQEQKGTMEQKPANPDGGTATAPAGDQPAGGGGVSGW